VLQDQTAMHYYIDEIVEVNLKYKNTFTLNY